MSDIIDVWFVPLDTPAGAGSSCADILTDEELDRAARFRKPRDRSRWAASRLALRTILATWTSVDARHVALVNGDNGKPRLLPNAHTASPYFNLSHSGAAALVAVTPRFALGVDIEQERSFADMLRVADRVFTVNERAELAALSEKEFVRAFFTAWTRKEQKVPDFLPIFSP